MCGREINKDTVYLRRNTGLGFGRGIGWRIEIECLKLWALAETWLRGFWTENYYWFWIVRML